MPWSSTITLTTRASNGCRRTAKLLDGLLGVRAGRYGMLVIAKYAAQVPMMRDASGMSSPASPSG